MSHRVLTSFKAYDIRGRIGIDIDEDVAYRVGRAVAQHLAAKSIVVGYDARSASAVTSDVVKEVGADFGVAFDGDLDRCFRCDGEGQFVPGEYVRGLLAEAFLATEPGGKVVHDPRVILNTLDLKPDTRSGACSAAAELPTTI